jgi:hypothetical protein
VGGVFVDPDEDAFARLAGAGSGPTPLAPVGAGSGPWAYAGPTSIALVAARRHRAHGRPSNDLPPYVTKPFPSPWNCYPGSYSIRVCVSNATTTARPPRPEPRRPDPEHQEDDVPQAQKEPDPEHERGVVPRRPGRLRRLRGLFRGCARLIPPSLCLIPRCVRPRVRVRSNFRREIRPCFHGLFPRNSRPNSEAFRR